LILVLEKSSGTSSEFALLIQKYRRFTASFAKEIFKDVVEGVNYLHQRNIIHRDLKLENLLLEDRACKIIDFGFSKVIIEGEEIKEYCGTPSYCSPQLILKNNYKGKESDIWALGIILYRMLTGAFPFSGDN